MILKNEGWDGNSKEQLGSEGWDVITKEEPKYRNSEGFGAIIREGWDF